MEPAQAPGRRHGAAGGQRPARPDVPRGAALILLWLGLAQASEWRASVGGEVNADSHGAVELLVRGEEWQAGLYTETLDVRWTPEGDHGKAWIGGRFAGAAAGLLISPWTDGAPDPERALIAGYGGVELGAQRFLKHHLYVGAEGWAREHYFVAMDATAVAVPSPAFVARVDGVLGWWRPTSQARVIVGAHASQLGEQLLQPHIGWEAAARPDWPIHPRFELRVGWGEGQDRLTRTRLGGLNPYVVPVAGAAWAEWWVEDFSAVRLGPEVTVNQVSIGVISDFAVFDDQTALGFAATGRGQHQRFFVEGDLGYAPWIARQPGISRFSSWFRLGLDWG